MTEAGDDPRVLVDATAVPSDRGGVGRYVDEVLAQLTGDIVIVCKAEDAGFYRTLAPHTEVIAQNGIGRTLARLLWEQLVLPSIARRIRADVIFSPHYTFPLAARTARVVTFHDATFFSDPAVHQRLKRVFFRRWIRLSARIADVVIVPSSATASELDRFVHRRVGYVVALHGVNQTLFRKPSGSEIKQFRADSGLGEAPWIAFLGTIEPRKNVPALIRAYSELVARWNGSWGVIPTLALAGGEGWESGLDAELIAVAPPARVARLGFVPAENLRALLGGAEIVCYPSLGEGFGLPVLEAMACAAPVLTTRRLAIPEVGGLAVAYTDVSPVAIAAGLEALVSDSSLRDELGAAGFTRAAQFTWRASAEVHESAFRAAAKARNEGEP
jgi:glycosyltransferase involved in cell wall biosynthesis